MFDIKNIINILNDKLDFNLVIDKKLSKKQTARSLLKYILKDTNNKKYLLEIAQNSIERFYFKRTIEHQKKLSELKHNFKLNMPLYVQSGNKLSYVIYEYFDNIAFVKDNKPIELLNQLYEKNSIEIKVTAENIENILSNFLSAWPNKYHSMIRRQKEFQDYKKELNKYDKLKVCYEHGDYSTNNIFNFKNYFYLMAFEFARDFQLIGFDSFYYLTSIKNSNKINNNKKYQYLHNIKYALIEKINKRIDNDDINIEIYDNLNDVILKNGWNNLYYEGANYNLSLQWCKTWIKYFLKKNQNIFIFTIWKDNKLVFLAPLYKIKSNLYLIGSNPDLFDSFSLLYSDEKYIKKFYDFVFNHKYNIVFKYLDADSTISKLLIKYLYQNNISYESQIIDTKPKTNFESFKIKTKENSDMKRCKNRAIKNYNNELSFNANIIKNTEVLNEFISIHKERWGAGPFESIDKYDLFIQEISTTDLVVLSRLDIKNETVAYHLGYKDSNGILNSAIPSYSNKYNDISPGKVLLYEVLKDCKDKNDEVFDFGRGAEEYKYWFSNESSILFHITTYSNENILKKIQNISNRIFNKLYRVFYVV